MSNSSNVSSITETQMQFAFGFAQYCTIPGACVCFLVLVVCAVAACFPGSRQHLDRVSFRLIISALISHVLFGISYTAAPVSPGPLCSFAAFTSTVFVCYSTFLTTCIAINLQLVVVHHINGLQMEKYYLIGSTVLTIVLNVPAYALNQFGWDASSSVCWYKNPNRTDRLHWMIATDSVPLILAATIETICSCILLMYMYLVRRGTSPFFASFILSSIRSTSRRAAELNPSHVESLRQQQSMDISQHPRYRKAILWIVLYPLTSLLVNFITVSLDLSSTIRGVNTQLDFRLLILDLSLVGMRTLPYGLLAAFDPALISAVREFLAKVKSRPGTVTTRAPVGFVTENQTLSFPDPQGTTTDRVETQSRLNTELASVGASNVVGENGNNSDDRVEQRIGVEKTGQELEGDDQYDCELEFQIIGRQF